MSCINDKLSELKRDILSKVKGNRALSRKNRKALGQGNSILLQNHLIEGARSFANAKNAKADHSEKAWLFCEYLEKFDPYSEHESYCPKKLLSGMLERTGGGNAATATEFLAFVSSSISNEASQKWATL
jgi:hypothetical protein